MGRNKSEGRGLTTLQRSFLLILLSMAVVMAISFIAVFLVNNAYVTGKNDIYILEKQEKLDRMMESLGSEIQTAEQQMLNLLSEGKVTQIAYSRDEMEPYSYYRQTLEIVGRMKEITDDFRIVRGIWLEIESIGLKLSQDGVARAVPIGEEAFADASQQEMHTEQGRVYIVRSLTDYQSTPSERLCTMILELDISALLDRCSLICLEGETVQLDLNGAVLGKGAAEPGKNDRQLTALAGNYPLRATLTAGPTRYRLSTDETPSLTYLVLILVCVMAGAFILYLYFRLYRPLELLLDEAFQHLEKGDLSYRIPDIRSGPFAGVYRTFNDSAEQLEYLLDHVYRQKLLISEMQLKHLQAQISPHFMYNTYYTLYRQIQDGHWDNSRQLARLLGDFYHYITRSGGTEKTLREEVGHTLTYVEIQTMRFPDTIQEIEPLPEEIAGMTVPQLILQPVFENVFQHAREHLHPGEPLRFAMRYEAGEDLVRICVENNGELSDETIRRLQDSLEHADDQEEMTGLLNIHRRLQLFYGGEAGLSVSRSRLGGLCVCMNLIPTEGRPEDGRKE